MKNLRKPISIFVVGLFFLKSTLAGAALPPLSLSQMYGYAASGNVRVLRAAVQRGLNIDAMDRNGNTGLCYAILKGDKVAYNAFRAAGANPQPPCVQNINQHQYGNFTDSYGVAGVEESPRAAYNQFNEGEYIISKKTWIIGGLLLLATGIGIAAASSGGGSSNKGGGGTAYEPTGDNFGDYVGKKKPIGVSGYKPIAVTAKGGATKDNTKEMTLDNDNSIEYVDENDIKQEGKIIELVDFHTDMLKYANYLKVGMKAFTNSIVNNNSTIALRNGTVGMVALGTDAQANNNATIQINAKNATVGMVASDGGRATNEGYVQVSFSGDDDKHQISAMYADVGGTITNNRMIQTVSSKASKGTVIGMQGRLINQNTEGSKIINLVNGLYGTINLSNTSVEEEVSNSLIGMGSFLDETFLDGVKLISMADSVDILNRGNIMLKSTLVGEGSYTANIRNGSGGIIGILADANTFATNKGNITVEVEANQPEEGGDYPFKGAHAGIVSQHGGKVLNEGSITVKGGQNGYGIIAIRGAGTNSEFDLVKPSVTNSGNVTVDSVDGFGIVSYHGGTIYNSGTVHMVDKGVAIQSNVGTITNTNSILLDNGGIGINIEANPIGEGSANYDTTGTTVNNNSNGNITINKANDSYGIKIAYGKINNYGKVNLNNINSSSDKSSYGLYAKTGTIDNYGEVNVNINTVGNGAANVSYGIWSDSAVVENHATGKVTFELTGTGMYTNSGKVTNDGTVWMKGGGKGIETKTGNITNNNLVRLSDTGTGIETKTGAIENNAKVLIDGHNSTGIKSESIVKNNSDAEILVNGKNGVGIDLADGGSAINDGLIKSTSDVDGNDNYGIRGAEDGTTNITNNSNIVLEGNASYINNNKGYGISNGKGNITNNGNVLISGFYGYGMNTVGGIAYNNKIIKIGGSGGTGMQGGENGSIVNAESGTIEISGVLADEVSYGMKTTKGTARNDGLITVNDPKSYGIYADNGQGVNNKSIIIKSKDSTGIGAMGTSGLIINSTGATITMEEINSTGMEAADGKAYNNGEIIFLKDGAIGMSSTSGSAYNDGLIDASTLSALPSVGMQTNTGTIQNSDDGEIKLSKGTGMIVKDKNGTAINDGTINIIGSGDGVVVVGEGTATNNGVINTASGSGMTVGEKGNITNSQTGHIYATESGMSANGSGAIATNKGNISVSGNGSGMVASNKGTVINDTDGVITVEGSNPYVIYATDEDSVAINRGTVNVANRIMMYGDRGAKIDNYGTLTMVNQGAMYVTDEGSSANNYGNIVYSGTDWSLRGMYGTEKTSLTNAATGSITMNAGAGMYVLGEGASATNDGNIKVGGLLGYGMRAGEGAKLINSTTGIISSSFYGMSADGISESGKAASAVNYGRITNNIDSGGLFIGMDARNGATVVNEETGKIMTSWAFNTDDDGDIVGVLGSYAVGMSADGEGSKAVNKGLISIANDTEDPLNLPLAAVGMMATGGAEIYNAATGTISIYSNAPDRDDEPMVVGMYASGAGSKIYNEGTIIINGNTCAAVEGGSDCGGGNFIVVKEGAEFKQGGLMVSTTSINLNSITSGGGKFIMEVDSQIDAPEVSGYGVAGTSIMLNNFNKVNVVKNAIIGNAENLELGSESFAGIASVVDNGDGTSDIEVKNKEWSDLISDTAFASYIGNAYDVAAETVEGGDEVSDNVMKVFNNIKKANNQNNFTRAINSQFGLDYFPSFARQSQEAAKSLSRSINHSMFADNSVKDVYGMVGYDFYNKDQERSGVVQGYEEDANSIYGLVQKRHSSNFSYGAGLTLTQLDSKYDYGSKREETILHILAPMKYKTSDLAFVSIPRIGYGWGESKRLANGEMYKADTTNYYYGVTNEVRKDIDLSHFTLEPVAEFNVLGVYQDQIKEKQQLTVKSSNNLSIEAGIGLYVKKLIEFGEDNILKLRAGGSYYQEFNDAYNSSKANMYGMAGMFNMKGYEAERYRGVLSVRADYEYRSFVFFGEMSKLIERDGATSFNIGIEYRF